MEDWALIRRLAAEGEAKARIAARLGISRTTVYEALKSASPPKYERGSAASSFTPVEARVRELLAEFPRMPATVLAERVGWTGSITWFRQNVRRLRPQYAPADPADRLEYSPGDQAQCDLWFPPARIPLGQQQHGSPPVLVIACSFSRFLTARMLPSRVSSDLLGGVWSLLSEQIGAVPRRLVWDNEAGIGQRGRLADGVAAFTGALASRIVQLPPRDPESKGIVERANRFLETSFLPGRSFSGPDDFNAQLHAWLPRANQRLVRATGARPIDRLEGDRAAMLPLPPIAPLTAWSARVRLGRDYYVRVLGNDYSIDPVAIGRMIDVHADLETVTALMGGRVIAAHRRAWSRRGVITDPAHVQSAARLRAAFQNPPPPPADDALVRDLCEYDRAFGLLPAAVAVTG